MHDYGVGVRLEDVESGKVVTRVVATRDSAGKLVKVSRKLYGVSGEGLKLKANHKYRVVGEYDNPTGETLVKGAMAHIVGLFVPDDMSKWPRIDPSDPTYQRDLASLQVRGDVSAHHGDHAGHEGMKEGMKMDSMPGMEHGQTDHGQMDHGEHGAHQ
jgi:hypothetical protein